MKNVFSAVLAVVLAAPAPYDGGGDCGNSLLFHKGLELRGSVYDGQGKEINRTVSIVTKVYDDGGMHVTEMDTKTTDAAGANEKDGKTLYKCDGDKLYIDLSGLMPSGQTGSKIQTSAMEFPFKLTAGETLPEASYSVTMTVRGQPHTMISHIKERKVEAKEAVTTPAGTFSCYRVSSTIEVDNGMEMSDKQRQAMEQMKQRMGKTRMIYWYAPELTVIKMEYYMGEKLLSRTEITGIKK